MGKLLDHLRLQYPQITEQEEERSAHVPEGWDGEAGKALLHAIEEFKSARKGRYPKNLGELSLTDIQFAKQSQFAFYQRYG